MKYILAGAALFAVGLAANTANAMLAVGTKAPDFTAQASLGGKEFSFSLAGALKKGPVVLYFYPAAFTTGCTIEAHDFAEATDRFKALGATVIGVSHDNIATLDKFSVSECRSKFAVVADPDEAIIKSYDVVLAKHPQYSDRTSFVIAPNHKVTFAYENLEPDNHVTLTIEAVKDWNDTHGRK